MKRLSKLKQLAQRHAARHHEVIGIVVIFIAFIGAVAYGSTGEAFPVPVPKTTTVTVPFSPH